MVLPDKEDAITEKSVENRRLRLFFTFLENRPVTATGLILLVSVITSVVSVAVPIVVIGDVLIEVAVAVLGVVYIERRVSVTATTTATTTTTATATGYTDCPNCGKKEVEANTECGNCGTYVNPYNE